MPTMSYKELQLKSGRSNRWLHIQNVNLTNQIQFAENLFNLCVTLGNVTLLMFSAAAVISALLFSVWDGERMLLIDSKLPATVYIFCDTKLKNFLLIVMYLLMITVYN